MVHNLFKSSLLSKYNHREHREIIIEGYWLPAAPERKRGESATRYQLFLSPQGISRFG